LDLQFLADAANRPVRASTSFRRAKRGLLRAKAQRCRRSRVVLVPINNRIASLNTAVPALGWERDHRKWDVLRRVRILLPVVAVLALTSALVA
jgi:hypothetical protein